VLGVEHDAHQEKRYLNLISGVTHLKDTPLSTPTIMEKVVHRIISITVNSKELIHGDNFVSFKDSNYDLLKTKLCLQAPLYV